MLSRRSMSLFTRYLSRSRGPIALILQGFFFILIGLIVALLNLNHVGHIQKVTGSISDVFGGSYISLAGSQDAYTFVLDDFHPHWNGIFFQGQKVDIYYESQMANLVVAMQLYDRLDNPSLKLTTTAYDQNPSIYQIPGLSPGVGIGILAVGLLIAAFGGFRLYRYNRDHQDEIPTKKVAPSSLQQSLDSLSSQQGSYQSSAYISPSATYPPQEGDIGRR